MSRGDEGLGFSCCGGTGLGSQENLGESEDSLEGEARRIEVLYLLNDLLDGVL